MSTIKIKIALLIMIVAVLSFNIGLKCGQALQIEVEQTVGLEREARDASYNKARELVKPWRALYFAEIPAGPK